MEKHFIKVHISENERMKVVYMEEPNPTIEGTLDLSGTENKTHWIPITFTTKEFDIPWTGTKVDKNFNWDAHIASFLSNNIPEHIHIEGIVKDPAYRMHHNYASFHTLEHNNHLPVLTDAERNVFNAVHEQAYELFHLTRACMDAIVYIAPKTEEDNKTLIGMIKKLRNVTVQYNEHLPLDEIFITMSSENSTSAFIGFQYTNRKTSETFVLIDSPIGKENAINHYRRIRF